MKNKLIKQSFLISFLLFSLITQLYFYNVKAESKIVNVANGKLYYQTNGHIGFRHPEAKITLTVTSGTLNGSGMSLAMYSTSGSLKFTSQNTSTITLTSTNEATLFAINGKANNTASIVPSTNYVIAWRIIGQPFPLPIMMIIGIIGVCGFIGSPCLIALKLTSGDNPGEKIKFSINMAIIWLFSFAFLLAVIIGGI